MAGPLMDAGIQIELTLDPQTDPSSLPIEYLKGWEEKKYDFSLVPRIIIIQGGFWTQPSFVLVFLGKAEWYWPVFNVLAAGARAASPSQLMDHKNGSSSSEKAAKDL